MIERAIPAVFMRGGTSKAIMFQAHDLPAERAEWDALFTAAMGTPDPYGRQLNGMGGGSSSVSKICVLSPSKRDDADVDYTFAQVLIRENRVDYKGNCGNMSSAVGPFAVDQNLVRPTGDDAHVRIHNTNTGKIINATFALRDGVTRYDGDLVIPGVAGTGAPIRLDFLQPGGATTGKLLPTGQVVDRLDVPGVGTIDASLVDAANASVFVRARDIGLTGLELPEQIEGDVGLVQRLEAIRHQGAIRMGIAADLEAARASPALPYLGVVSPPQDATIMSGETLSGDSVDLHARVMASGQPHRALPLTVSLCAAVAARITGTVVAEMLRPASGGAGAIRIGMPSGVLTVDADVAREGDTWVARTGAFYPAAPEPPGGKADRNGGRCSRLSRRRIPAPLLLRRSRCSSP